MIDLQVVKWRLAETIAWCTPRVNINDPENSLRSIELDPQAEIGSFQAAMAKVATKRADLLRENNQYPSVPVEKLKIGRLLLYFPDFNTVSGEVTNETDNFFDDYHIPPWDTWVSFWVAEEPSHYGSNFIFCWIPPQFEDLVSAGIGVCMLGDVEWADNLESKYTIKKLKEDKVWPDLEALLTQLLTE